MQRGLALIRLEANVPKLTFRLLRTVQFSMLWIVQEHAVELFFGIMHTKPECISSALFKIGNPPLPRRVRYVAGHQQP